MVRTMAPTPVQNIPAQITAGDTVTWSRRAGDYPATAGWVLGYTAISSTAVHNWIGTADGDDYVVTLDTATTAAWTAGPYRVQEYVTSSDGSQRFTLATYNINVLPNLAASTGGLDTRSHAQKVLDSINAYLETKTPVYANMEINGRKIAWYPLPDLLKLRDRYALMVATEQRQASGRRGGNRILAVL